MFSLLFQLYLYYIVIVIYEISRFVSDQLNYCLCDDDDDYSFVRSFIQHA